MEGQTEEYLVRCEAALRRHPEIQEWYLMTGDGDYILRVQIAGIDAYGAFHRDILSRLPGVSRITSSFAMRTHRRLSAIHDLPGSSPSAFASCPSGPFTAFSLRSPSIAARGPTLDLSL